jgi:hypothetical protein
MWSSLLLLTGLAILARPVAPKVVGSGIFGAFVVASLFLQPPASYQFSALPLLVLVACLVAEWPTTLDAKRRQDARVGTGIGTTASLPRSAPAARPSPVLLSTPPIVHR